MFYDGSECVDSHIRGAGYVIIKEGLEVGGGFETIPLDSNNLGEFLGCLVGIQQVIGFGQHVEMVGHCKILTEAAPKTKPIDNFEFNEILSEIRNIAESNLPKWSTLMCITNSTRGQMQLQQQQVTLKRMGWIGTEIQD